MLSSAFVFLRRFIMEKSTVISNEKKVAGIYIRVSTEDQVRERI